MKNKLYIAVLAIIVLISINNICNAENNKGNDFPPPPPHEFIGKRPSKEEMEAKKLEFEKRLNLTEAQKKQIEADKQKDREIIKPIIEKSRSIKKELHAIEEDTTFSDRKSVV